METHGGEGESQSRTRVGVMGVRSLLPVVGMQRALSSICETLRTRNFHGDQVNGTPGANSEYYPKD